MTNQNSTRRTAMGVRVSRAGIQPVDAMDGTFDGTFWFDLRTRCPLASRAKRVIDVAGAAVAGALTAPVWILAALALSVTGGRTVLVAREAHGFRRNRLVMYEFRDARLLPRAVKRIPLLINVLAGTMSLVGPAPMGELEALMSAGMRRFAVLPGITGLAQVSNAATDEERAELDRQYVNEWTLGLDFEILSRAVRRLI